MTVEPLTRRYHPRRPLDLAATLAPLWRGGYADPAFRAGGGAIWRATRNADGPITMSLRGDGDWVDIAAWGPGAALALDRAPTLLGEDDDDSDFQPVHPLLVELKRRHPQVRICRSEAVIEALVPTVMEQKVIGLEARRGYRRLVLSLGEPAPGPGGLRLPPAPSVLTHTPYWKFHPFAVERRRAETIARAAGSATRLEGLTALPAAEARSRLEAQPGLGPWSAAEITIVALGDADAVSVGDFHLPNMVCHALAGAPRGDDATMLELLEPYRGHRGRVIRLLMSAGIRAPRYGPRLALRHMERH
ncbi:MAG TPA: DNA-3-methyladenine glycosylase 2 family protein [Candidatus Dormibacteraeota bacterium]|nr:DNA-3-methyladenine glycosylase 2 family protein [Candidatus Dormibacteraeota bacterium]